MMPDYLKYDNCLKEYDHILSIFKNDTGSFDSRRTKDKKDGGSMKGNEQLEFEI
jgi:hypothetical protein